MLGDLVGDRLVQQVVGRVLADVARAAGAAHLAPVGLRSVRKATSASWSCPRRSRPQHGGLGPPRKPVLASRSASLLAAAQVHALERDDGVAGGGRGQAPAATRGGAIRRASRTVSGSSGAPAAANAWATGGSSQGAATARCARGGRRRPSKTIRPAVHHDHPVGLGEDPAGAVLGDHHRGAAVAVDPHRPAPAAPRRRPGRAGWSGSSSSSSALAHRHAPRRSRAAAARRPTAVRPAARPGPRRRSPSAPPGRGRRCPRPGQPSVLEAEAGLAERACASPSAPRDPGTPAPHARRSRPGGGHVCPARRSRTRPLSSPPWKWGTSPSSRPQQGRLAASPSRPAAAPARPARSAGRRRPAPAGRAGVAVARRPVRRQRVHRITPDRRSAVSASSGDRPPAAAAVTGSPSRS